MMQTVRINTHFEDLSGGEKEPEQCPGVMLGRVRGGPLSCVRGS